MITCCENQNNKSVGRKEVLNMPDKEDALLFDALGRIRIAPHLAVLGNMSGAERGFVHTGEGLGISDSRAVEVLKEEGLDIFTILLTPVDGEDELLRAIEERKAMKV